MASLNVLYQHSYWWAEEKYATLHNVQHQAEIGVQITSHGQECGLGLDLGAVMILKNRGRGFGNSIRAFMHLQVLLTACEFRLCDRVEAPSGSPYGFVETRIRSWKTGDLALHWH
jgi:hypothetical protein